MTGNGTTAGGFPAAWIAVDWGTSNVRAWAMGAEGAVLARAGSDDGMGRLKPDEFEPALLRLAEPWLGAGVTPVIACGMVGARQGWTEAAYRAVPCAANGGDLTRAPCKDARLDVRLIPGVMQDDPADVMRGEETQIAGYLAATPDFDGVLCLPGTHTKWVRISAGEIVSFQTFMTGEIFAALSSGTVLRHSVTTDGWDQDAFVQAVGDAMSRPESFAARAFGLRAAGLLHGMGAETARARLSGLLLGAELAGARPYWLGQRVALIGAPKLTGLYAAALAAQGLDAEQVDGDPLSLAGLGAVYLAQRG